jgi:hypothetical protein
VLRPGSKREHGSSGLNLFCLKSDQARDGYVVRFDTRQEVTLLCWFRSHFDILATDGPLARQSNTI